MRTLFLRQLTSKGMDFIRRAANNSTFAIGLVASPIDIFNDAKGLVLRILFCAIKPTQRKSTNFCLLPSTIKAVTYCENDRPIATINKIIIC